MRSAHAFGLPLLMLCYITAQAAAHTLPSPSVSTPGVCLYPGDIVCTPTCAAIALCMPTPAPAPATDPPTYTLEILETCPATTSCYIADVACSATKSTCDPPRPIRCTGLGMYPDPTDCTRYHVCTSFTDPPSDSPNTLQQCEPTYAFDPYRKTCSVLMNATSPRSCVQSPVPLCTTLGQSGALCDNASMYYICVRDEDELFPVVYECAHGEVYEEDKFKCADEVMHKGGIVVNGCTDN